MKKLFVSVLAVAALASCAKEELVSLNQEAIQFGGPFVENATRAADNTYNASNLNKFHLYGTVTGTNGTINIYNQAIVTGTVGSDVWACKDSEGNAINQYWIADATYKFAAVVDADGVTKDGNNMPTALTYNTDGQKDLLYTEATATGQASNNAPVNFTFAHLLSKAYFTVKSNTANGYYHSVTNIKVNNFETGTYTIGATTPWAGTTAKDIAFGDITEVTSADTNGKTNATQMLLIPTATSFNVTFTVEIWNGSTKLGTETYTKTITIKDAEENIVGLEAGKVYNFTLGLTVGELIQFTVTTAPNWVDAPDVPVTL